MSMNHLCHATKASSTSSILMNCVKMMPQKAKMGWLKPQGSVYALRIANPKAQGVLQSFSARLKITRKAGFSLKQGTPCLTRGNCMAKLLLGCAACRTKPSNILCNVKVNIWAAATTAATNNKNSKQNIQYHTSSILKHYIALQW